MLRFATGVPFPEHKYKDHPEWIVYCRETNIFALWFAYPEDDQKGLELNKVGNDSIDPNDMNKQNAA